MTDINYTFNKSNLVEINQHLFDCSDSFVPKLSSYVNIDEYSNKIYQKSLMSLLLLVTIRNIPHQHLEIPRVI